MIHQAKGGGCTSTVTRINPIRMSSDISPMKMMPTKGSKCRSLCDSCIDGFDARAYFTDSDFENSIAHVAVQQRVFFVLYSCFWSMALCNCCTICVTTSAVEWCIKKSNRLSDIALFLQAHVLPNGQVY